MSSAIHCAATCESVRLENCILAAGRGAPVYCYSPVHLTCCDVWGNEGGDWVGCIADQYGLEGNLCADPLFCDPVSGDFHLQEGSPCAPGGDCDQIGAWPVGCAPTGARPTTWGEIKAMFR